MNRKVIPSYAIAVVTTPRTQFVVERTGIGKDEGGEGIDWSCSCAETGLCKHLKGLFTTVRKAWHTDGEGLDPKLAPGARTLGMFLDIGGNMTAELTAEGVNLLFPEVMPAPVKKGRPVTRQVLQGGANPPTKGQKVYAKYGNREYAATIQRVYTNRQGVVTGFKVHYRIDGFVGYVRKDAVRTSR